jgi:uncharacterized protein YutE (UPF0331/DUF86 family)
MDERIKDHLQHLNMYYLQLVDLRKMEREAVVRDAIIRGATERFLQLAIESCLNIGNRIISLNQLEHPLKAPQTYADIFLRLEELRVIDRELTQRLVTMAKFRNRLVHLYWEIDADKVFDIIRDNLDDFKSFEMRIVEFLKCEK